MTRYEQLKPGLSFLFGKAAVSTIGKAVSKIEENMDCTNCPFCKECDKEADAFHDRHPDEWWNPTCRPRIKKYLQEEIKD
jgi:hypothetical protein